MGRRAVQSIEHHAQHDRDRDGKQRDPAAGGGIPSELGIGLQLTLERRRIAYFVAGTILPIRVIRVALIGHDWFSFDGANQPPTARWVPGQIRVSKRFCGCENYFAAFPPRSWQADFNSNFPEWLRWNV